MRPRLVAWLLGRIAPAGDRVDLLDELESEFRERVSAEGMRAARRWYRAQALRSILPLMRRRAELLLRPLRRSGPFRLVPDFVQDLRFAFRSVRRRPLFALVAVVALGLGIGATTAMFSVANMVLIRPLPVPEPDRLHTLLVEVAAGGTSWSVSYPDYLDYRAAGGGFSDLAAHHVSDITLAGPAGARAALAMDVSGNYWDVLRIRPSHGRFFGEAEASGTDPAPVVVISHAFWQTRFGGDPAAVGTTLEVNGHPLTVIGVAPAGFHGTMLGARPVGWLPLGLYPRLHPGFTLESRTRHSWLQVFGRLGADVEGSAVEAGLTVTAAGMAATHDYPDFLEPARIELTRFTALPPGLREAAEGFVALLLAAAMLVLVIATVNVSGMLLARASTRHREMGIRLSLGAGRGRLIRQLLVEGLVLAVAGGALGVGLAALFGSSLSRFQPPFARGLALAPAMDWRVLSFAAATALVTSVLFALAPALYTTRSTVVGRLRFEGPAGRAPRLRGALVGGQVALSVVLLVATALLARTLQSALTIDHGMEPEGVVALELDAGLAGYEEGRARVFYRTLLERVRTLPDVESAAVSSGIPMGMSWNQTWARMPGHESPDPDGFVVGFAIVSPGFFETVRMPILAGRPLAQGDGRGERWQIVVNEAFARRFWPDRGAVGQVIGWSGGEAEIVGVAPTGKYRSPSEEELLFAYVPMDREIFTSMWLYVRPRGATAAALSGVRRELAALDPDLPIVTAGPLKELMGGALFVQRAAAVVIGAFGAIGLALAAIGIFGLLAFVVTQRTREIGVRVALGAAHTDILRSVVSRGLLPVVVGLALGLILAWALGQLLAGLLHGVGPSDPTSFATAALVLLAVSAAAAWLPARRAIRVDPARVLREE